MSEPEMAEGTGDPRVDEMVAALAAAQEASPQEQIAALTEADRVLREALDSIGDI